MKMSFIEKENLFINYTKNNLLRNMNLKRTTDKYCKHDLIDINTDTVVEVKNRNINHIDYNRYKDDLLYEKIKFDENNTHKRNIFIVNFFIRSLGKIYIQVYDITKMNRENEFEFVRGYYANSFIDKTKVLKTVTFLRGGYQLFEFNPKNKKYKRIK